MIVNPSSVQVTTGQFQYYFFIIILFWLLFFFWWSVRSLSLVFWPIEYLGQLPLTMIPLSIFEIFNFASALSLCCVSERKLHSLHIASAQLTREMINNLFGPSTILTCSGSFLYWKWIDVTQKEGLLFTLTPVVLLYQKHFEKLPKIKI